MWRHLVAITAAILVTLVALEFWGEFGTAMSKAVQISADSANDKPMPVTVITSDPDCGAHAPCPNAPAADPDGHP
jgi:hypothetical protein